MDGAAQSQMAPDQLDRPDRLDIKVIVCTCSMKDGLRLLGFGVVRRLTIKWCDCYSQEGFHLQGAATLAYGPPRA